MGKTPQTHLSVAEVRAAGMLSQESGCTDMRELFEWHLVLPLLALGLEIRPLTPVERVLS